MVHKDTLGNDISGDVPVEKHSAHINELPPEILAEIFSNVELVQLSSLRLVCRYWNVIVSDNAIWQKSFRTKFGSDEIFPSFAHTRSWVMEYLSRVQNLKKWRKAEATHVTYEVPNLSITDHCLASFTTNRLLSYSNHQNDITICTLHNGRSQTFLPGFRFGVRSYAINWHYFVFGTYDGGLYIKNLNMPASYGVTQQESLKEVIPSAPTGSDEIIKCVDINHHSDKHKVKMDIITGSTTGYLRLFNLCGTMLHQTFLGGEILKLKSDFKKDIVVLTQDHLFIIDLHTYEVRDFVHELTFNPHEKLIVDFDLADHNVIISNANAIRVLNYANDSFRVRRLDVGFNVTLGKLQDHRPGVKRDTNLVGQDGLLYANVLEDDSVIIWNVREQSEAIHVRCKFQTDFKYKSLGSFIHNGAEITALDLNSSVIVVSGYVGFSNVHDVFTGKFIRDVSVKFPKKYGYMHSQPIPVSQVKLHENARTTCGVILCGNLVQYFQFGEVDREGRTNKKAKETAKETSDRKDEMKKKIRDQMDDYDLEKYENSKLEEMFEKYNGSEYTSEDELMIAIALSKSSHENTSASSVKSPVPLTDTAELHPDDDIDEELRQALELSKAQAELESMQSTKYGKMKRNKDVPEAEDELDEELARAIELSKQSATGRGPESHFSDMSGSSAGPMINLHKDSSTESANDITQGSVALVDPQASRGFSSHNEDMTANLTEEEQLKMILELSLVDQ